MGEPHSTLFHLTVTFLLTSADKRMHLQIWVRGKYGLDKDVRSTYVAKQEPSA